jgi:uracil-DNA glycosylase
MKQAKETFESLEQRITMCRRCPRLVAWRERVAREKVRRFQDQHYWGRPVPAFGALDGRLVIVGLAPAAHGGNRTGRIFTGDRSGDWLYASLHRFGFANQPDSRHRDDGLELPDCLVTAAVRCAPPDNKPLPEEYANCRPYLCQELSLDPAIRVVVALGQIAFRSFLRAWRDIGREVPVPAPQFGHGLEYALSTGQTLIASYHPSQQNTSTGKLTRDMLDAVFGRARSLVDAGPR